MDNDSYSDEQNSSRLKDLAERLLDYDYYVDTDSDKPRLFLGELPTDLLAEIPVPEGLVLLGGLRRRSPWHGEPDAEVILEAGVEPEGVYDAFREHLAGSEWSERRWPLVERGGFVSTGSGGRSLTLCLSPRGPALLRAPGVTRPAPTITTATDTTSALFYRRCSRQKGLLRSRVVAEAVRVRKKTTLFYEPACPLQRSWSTTRRS